MIAKGNLEKILEMSTLGENKRHIQEYLLHWEHKDTLWMVFFDQEITNPTMGSKVERGKSAEGQSPLIYINEDVDIFEVGESDMPF